MEISHRLDDDICILEPVGNILWGESKTFSKYLESILETESTKGLVINLKQVDSIDSGGIGAILSIHKQFTTLGYPFVLCHLSKHVSEVFHFTKVINLFTIYSTEDDALASL